MSDYIELSKLLNDPLLSPEMRAFAEKLKGAFKPPKKTTSGASSKGASSKAFLYAKPKEYFLELNINCLCCGGERKELYFMRDNKDGSLKAEQAWIMANSPRPEGIKEKKIRVHTCKECRRNLEKLSKEELIERLYGVFEGVLKQAVKMPRKPRLKIRDFNKED